MVVVMKAMKMTIWMMMILVGGRRKVNDLCGPTMQYWQVSSSVIIILNTNITIHG